MENASKALLIAGAVLIAIVIIASAIAILGNGANSGKDAEKIGGEISSSTQEATEQIQAGLSTLQNGNKEEIKITAIKFKNNEYTTIPDYDYKNGEIYTVTINKSSVLDSIEPENATNKDLEWTYRGGDGCIDSFIINEKQIIINFNRTGNVEIIAKAKDGSGTVSDSYKVVFYNPGGGRFDEEGYDYSGS